MWIVEIPNDGVGCPAHGHEVEEPSDGKEGPGDAGEAGLDAVDADAFSALDSEDPEGQSHTAHQDGEHGEAPGSLHVAGQSQHAVVHFTLDLTGALHDAVHPEAFPDDLSRNDVVSDESGDSPQGDGADYCPTHPAHNGHDQTQQLHACSRHGDSFLLDGVCSFLVCSRSQKELHWEKSVFPKLGRRALVRWCSGVQLVVDS